MARVEQRGKKKKKMKIGDMIKPMDYCWVISDKKMKGSGLYRSDMVMVTGVKPVPASKKDLYLQRLLVIVVKVDDEKVLIPSQDNDYRAYLVDPRNLEKVDEETLAWAQDNLKNQYKE